MKKKIVTLFLVAMFFCSTAFAGSAQFPLIVNLTLSSANVEYSTTLTGAKKFTIQCRTNYAVRFAYVTGKVATPTAPYITIKAGSVYWEDDISLDRTLYFASSEVGVIVEIIYFK